jgi:hypothetical protein
MAISRGSDTQQTPQMPWTGLTKRRLCHLTLARQEWADLLDALDAMPEVADTCRPSIEWLREQIAASSQAADELLTVAQPPLAWSPLVIGLAMHVLTRPNLLDLAERLRVQMMAQAKRLESPVSMDYPEQMRRWPAASSDGLGQRIGLN